jgi:CcmD family protein
MMALQTPPSAPADSGYKPVVGDPAATQPSISAPALVGAAYGFIWLAVLVFLITIWRRGRETEREIDELRRKLDAAGAAARAGGGGR